MVDDVCEVCGEFTPPPVLATVAFKRGKVRRVCVMCCARAIQGVTGFKMVNSLQRMLEARATAPQISLMAKEARAALLREEIESGI